MSVFIILAALMGRITEWQHFPHYGGGYGIISRGDVLMAATSGGLLFSHYSPEENTLVVDSGWTSPGKLSYDRVSHVTYDDSGNLWVSMNGGGIDMFTPGGKKTHFNQIDGLPLNLGINQTLLDSVLYAATTQGLCIKRFSFFETFNSLSSGGGLPSDNITCLSSSDSGLYVGTTAGLVFLPESADPGNKNSWKSQNIDPASIIAMEWQNDTLWVATTAGLFHKRSDQQWVKDFSFPGDNISSLAWSPEGLAVGCTNQGFILTQTGWERYGTNLHGNALAGLVWHENRLCGLLTNTYAEKRLAGAGLALLLENGAWRRTFPHTGPASNDLRNSTLLPDGSVWVSSNSAGGSVYFNDEWQSINLFLTNINQCFAICQSGKGVFVSSIGHGVDWLSWQNGTVESSIHFDSNDGMLNDRIFCAANGDDHTVWFGHRTLEDIEVSGVTRLNWTPGDTTSVLFAGITGADGLPSKEVNALLPTGGRYSWIGTDGGLAYADGDLQKVRETYTFQDGLPSSTVTALAMDRSGVLYIGTASGLAYLNNEIITKVNAIDVRINALECDGLGSLWLSTDEGLKRFFRATGVVEEYTTFNSPLIDGTIYSMSVNNDDGYIYLATDHGFWQGELETALSGTGLNVMVYPDPFVPGQGDILSIAGIPNKPAEVHIYDIKGSLVFEFISSGREDTAWDGLNTNGVPAAAGVYFLQLDQDGLEFELLKFALVR